MSDPAASPTDPAPPTKPREGWNTRLGVILAVMGSAVGLGNFLRFPGLAAQYEGGTFMIPYFVALLLLGIPLAWAEWAIGRYGGTRGFNSAAGIYRSIWKGRAAPYFGVLTVLIPVIIYTYYVFIEGWCLAYAWFTLHGDLQLGNDSAKYGDFFGTFTGAGTDGFLMRHGGVNSAVLFLLVCFVLNFALIYRGLSKGIEKFCLYAMPLLLVCALIVLVRVLTLGTPDPAKPGQSLLNGLGFMWNLNTKSGHFWSHLANPQMWLDATGQIFFSLSVGFGIIVTYASYLRRDDDVGLSSLTSAAGNEFCEVALGGLITIPAAFVFLGATAVTAAAGSSFSLGFKVLPQVFALMPLGRFVGALFFFLLFLAAITSSLSMLQPAIALLEEGLGLGRKASVALLGCVTLTGSLFVVYFSKDLLALDTMDFWVGTFCIYILATFQTILFGWVLGARRGMEEVNRGSALRVPAAVGFLLKYVSPVYLVGLFVAFVWQQAHNVREKNRFAQIVDSPVVLVTLLLIAVIAGFFAFVIARSVVRWRNEGRFDAIDAADADAAYGALP